MSAADRAFRSPICEGVRGEGRSGGASRRSAPAPRQCEGGARSPGRPPLDVGFRVGRGRRDQSIRGSVSNWWNGGGEDSVHSSVVAPSPQGLSGAGLPAISDQITLTKKIAMPATMIS